MVERQMVNSRSQKLISILQKRFGIQMVQRLIFVRGILRHPFSKIKEWNVIRKKIDESEYVDIKELKIWINNSRNLVLSSNNRFHYDMIESFWGAELKLVKKCNKNSVSPIVVCAVKDDLVRIVEFINYYRKLGVEKFIMIDNDSSDGTNEFLADQNDVLLYKVSEKYNSRRKTAWINRAIAMNGGEHWYIIVDSDEFFAFPEMDKVSLADYAKMLRNKNVFQVKTFMLDMYPKGKLCDESIKSESFIEDYCYFDADNDYYWFEKETGTAGGGMHARLFGLDSDLRTKISMIYYERGRFVVGSHHMFPLKDDIESEIGGVVKHYKFLPNDRKKIDKIVIDQNYANGSRMYKQYQNILSKSGGIKAFYSGSEKWDDSEAFEKLYFVNDLLV